MANFSEEECLFIRKNKFNCEILIWKNNKDGEALIKLFKTVRANVKLNISVVKLKFKARRIFFRRSIFFSFQLQQKILAQISDSQLIVCDMQLKSLLLDSIKFLKRFN